MTDYYRQPLRIVTYTCPVSGRLCEMPIWSDEDIAERDALLDKILEGAKEHDVNPEYYLKEFL